MTLSVLFYSVSMTSEDETIFLSRETRFEANITVATLMANVNFTRVDGSPKFLFNIPPPPPPSTTLNTHDNHYVKYSNS